VDKKVSLPKEKWVKVSAVETSLPMGTIEYVGVLTADRKVKVSSELGGIIEELHFERGDRVRKGALLTKIGTSSFRLQVKEA